MKKRLINTLSLLLFLSMFFAACDSQDNTSVEVATKNIWVSVHDGDDTADGSFETPFQTIHRAKEEVRNLNDDFYGNIVVNIKEGTYRLGSTLEFTDEDSGKNGFTVTYRGADNGKVALVGSKKIDGWSPCDVKNNPNNIYCADAKKGNSRQLYVNGARAVRAKTEEYPGGFFPYYDVNIDDPSKSDPMGILFIPLQNMDGSLDTTWPDPSKWTNITDIEAVSLPQWKMQRVPLKSKTDFPNYDNKIVTGLEELLFYIYEITLDLSDDHLNYDLSKTGLIELQEPAWKNANLYLNPPDTSQAMKIWSFFRVAFFENALEFLDEPGEWYLEKSRNTVYYIPKDGENMQEAEVEMPSLTKLMDIKGSEKNPVKNLRFENLTFSCATWLEPSGNMGYIADQSGNRVADTQYDYNIIGHVEKVEETPGNIHLEYVNNIIFEGNIFEHLGAVALHFGTGTQNCLIRDNLFEDISSSAIWLGGVQVEDYQPNENQITINNTIVNNLIRYTGQEYYDSAAIYVGFTKNTHIDHNTIMHVPWSGIAMGWGWGLLDPGVNLGLSGATAGMWGTHAKFTPNSYNRITNNRTYATLEKLWDAGGVYTTGYQGTSMEDALLIEGNVFFDKYPPGGGNTIYTDGMSRYVKVKNNVLYNNPQGKAFFGKDVALNDPFYIQYAIFSEINEIPYGLDTGGCRTYGNIDYEGNYWFYSLFFSICPYSYNGLSFPTELTYNDNKSITTNVEFAQEIANNAGVYGRPASIPESRWILPSKEIVLGDFQ